MSSRALSRNEIHLYILHLRKTLGPLLLIILCHRLPEILGAFFWSLPALFVSFSLYFYVIFLTILLLDRARRDEERCSQRCGADWELYCQKVPYKIIPRLF